MSTLPTTPSALIRLALADLAKVEADPEYRVDMEYEWHTPSHILGNYVEPFCCVCLAGAVMARTMKVSKKAEKFPRNFNNEVAEKLYGLDYFRSNLITIGLKCFHVDAGMAETLGNECMAAGIDIPIYRPDSSPLFHSAMHKLADFLEEKGL